MKISELIAELEIFKEKYGDIKVTYHGQMGDFDITHFEYWKNVELNEEEITIS